MGDEAMGSWTPLLLGMLLVGAGLVPAVDMDTVQVDATAAQTHHVHIEDFEMEPNNLTIQPGDTVLWHNHDDVAHTATDDDDAWDTGTIPSDGSESITFDQERQDTYHCAVHPSQMTDFELNVVDNEDPSVEITHPSDGDELEGLVEITGTASDADGTVDTVEVRIDGGDWETATGAATWSYEWDTILEDDGEHTIEARSFDGWGYSPLATVTVTTENPTADLSLDALDVEQSLESATIHATVSNQGEVAAANTVLEVTYEASMASGTAGTVDVPTLLVDEQIELSLEWETLDKAGEFELTGLLDPDQVVQDPNRDNHERSATVCVPDAEGLTCQVPGIQVEP